MAAIGSPAWVARTGGALSLREQLRFAAQAIARELRGKRQCAGAVLAADRTPPSTAVAQHVTDFARTVLPDPLLQHSIRSWLWGSMLAELDRIEYDDERLYVAALLQLPWGAEAHLLHAGTHLDVVGLRLPEIARNTVAEVHAQAPRTGFADHFLAAMREEARTRSSSRAGVLWHLGMERSIRRFQDKLA